MYLCTYALYNMSHTQSILNLYKNNLRTPGHVPAFIFLTLGTTDKNLSSFVKTTLHHTVYSTHNWPGANLNTGHESSGSGMPTEQCP